jgi:hypothetical protein
MIQGFSVAIYSITEKTGERGAACRDRAGQGAGGITAGHARTRAVGAAKDWGRRRVAPIGGPCSALAGAGHLRVGSG